MKNDIQDFLKAHNIAALIEESIKSGKRKEMTITDEEFLKNITSEECFEKNYKELEEVYKNRDEKGFVSKLKERERNYVRRRNIRMVLFSTAVAAALVVLSFHLLKDENSSQIVPAVELTMLDKKMDVPVLITPKRVIKLVSETKEEMVEELPLREEEESVYLQRLVVPKGFTYSVVLSDSTEVILNAGSELSYASKFVGDKREVTLKGEAYFKVKKDAKPFFVTVGDVSIKVYGTQFNINSYDSEKIQTVLVCGSVGVNHQNKEVMLKPSQMATVDKKGKIDLSDVHVEKHLAWLRGEIINDNEPLTVFLNNVARWYGVEFEYAENIENINISAEVKNDRPLEEILKSIEIISGVKIIKIKDNKYMIRK